MNCQLCGVGKNNYTHYAEIGNVGTKILKTNTFNINGWILSVVIVCIVV